MSRLTRCTITADNPRPLSATALARVTIIFSALLSFGVAHLSLRFTTNKTRGETISMQSHHAKLMSEINALRGKNEAFKNPDHLFKHARLELGMTPLQSSQSEVLRVPAEVYRRYELARAEPALKERGETFWLSRISERLGLVGQAQAHESEEN